MTKLSKKELKRIRNNRDIRRSLARNSHYWFFCLYLAHYMEYEFAPFHHEIFRLTEEKAIDFAVLVAFRGSAKSTLVTLSYTIWSIIGIQQKKFVLIVSQTQYQARLHLTSIKKELESNELLKSDIGPFQEVSDEWGSYSIVVPKYGARITAVSTEQSIRGIRHGQHRPDLVVCDDIEDINSVKTKEGRNKTHTWFNGEVIPVGDKGTKIVVIGNLLHEDSLVMRLKQQIEDSSLDGSFFAFPLVDDNNDIAWPAKYPTMQDIEKLKAKFTLESAFYREHLLRIISDEDRLIFKEWIQYYPELPPTDSRDFEIAATGIDLAISQKESADFTAMVSAYVFGSRENLRIYILPRPVNKRMGFPETVETAINVSQTILPGQTSTLVIENTGYQDSLVQHLVSKGFLVEGFPVKGQDKRSRLALITHLIKQGIILFPEAGAEELIKQLVGFGVEKHDDLADAFSLLILWILKRDSEPRTYASVIALTGPLRVGVSMDQEF